MLKQKMPDTVIPALGKQREAGPWSHWLASLLHWTSRLERDTVLLKMFDDD